MIFVFEIVAKNSTSVRSVDGSVDLIDSRHFRGRRLHASKSRFASMSRRWRGVRSGGDGAAVCGGG